jgi:hypothetical protein
MATTVQNIVDRAVERSNLNDSSLILDDETEAYVSNLERQVFLIGASANPDYFGKEGVTAVRGSSTANWDLDNTPGNVAAVSAVEVEALVGTVAGVVVGNTINIISRRNPDVEIGPRVYLRDRVMFEYSNELQVNSSHYVSQLNIFYSHLPSARTTMLDTLDVPDEWDALLYLPLARVFAIRDQRPDEVPAIDAEFQLALSTFLGAVSVFDEGTVRSLEQISAASAQFGVSGSV